MSAGQLPGNTHSLQLTRARHTTMDITTSAQSLQAMRKFRSLGVVWGIFSVCYNIIVLVVFTQVRRNNITRNQREGITFLVKTQTRHTIDRLI